MKKTNIIKIFNEISSEYSKKPTIFDDPKPWKDKENSFEMDGFSIITDGFSLDRLESLMFKDPWSVGDVLTMVIMLVDNAFYFKSDIGLEYDVNKLIHAEIHLHSLMGEFQDNSIISANKTFIEVREELLKVREQL